MDFSPFTDESKLQVEEAAEPGAMYPAVELTYPHPSGYVSSLEGNFQINWFSSMELHCNDTVASIVNAPENAFRRPLW